MAAAASRGDELLLLQQHWGLGYTQADAATASTGVLRRAVANLWLVHEA